MEPRYERISRSLVARHPNPIGVVEFYGGQFFGQLPATSYDYFLGMLFQAGYTIIAVPFTFGFNHTEIAEILLIERDLVRAELPELAGVPRFWVGHSLGCKFIALLEASTDPVSGMFAPPGLVTAGIRRGILDEPSLLMAPDIGDTDSALPVPIVPGILDALSLGVRPTRAETQRLIKDSNLFNLTALISFERDRVAGNASEPPETSDVAWFLQSLGARPKGRLLHEELPGGHLVPFGIRFGDVVFELDPQSGFLPAEPPAELEVTAVRLLGELERRRATAVQQRMEARKG
ncbi:MAG: DUF1350 family protein [Chloroflexaceae bacterium]